MKKIELYLGVGVMLVALSLTSCRKEPLENKGNPHHRVCKTYSQQFEAVWAGMDQGYLFWDRDTVDWDERYEKYKPIFAEFDARPANKPVTIYEYNDAYIGLFEGLLDHHLYGRFYTPKGIPHGYCEATVRPGENDYRHSTDPDVERANQLKVLRKKAIPGTMLEYNPNSTYDIPGSYFCLIKGANDGELIAYFRFTNFFMVQMHQLYEYASNVVPDAVRAQAPAKAFYGPRYHEGISMEGAGYANNDSVVGIIIDLRGNGGGSVADLAPLIGSLAQTPTLVGYTRVKEGYGRLDYSAWSESWVDCPKNMHLKKAKPIVVLADIHSVSCAELATMLIKALPNGTFIGERTYGAIGGLYSGNATNIYHDLFYSGCFGDNEYFENGPDPYKNIFSYYVYTSTFHMVDSDHGDVEGIGVQPDIEIRYNKHLLESGTDNQLDRAIRFLRVGH
jgi:hypothetical protein